MLHDPVVTLRRRGTTTERTAEATLPHQHEPQPAMADPCRELGTGSPPLKPPIPITVALLSDNGKRPAMPPLSARFDSIGRADIVMPGCRPSSNPFDCRHTGETGCEDAGSRFKGS